VQGWGPSASQRFELELKTGAWAKWAVILFVVMVGSAVLVAWGWSATFRQTFHQLRVQSETGVVQPRPTEPVRLQLLNLLNVAVEVGFYVFVLRWQFQAAQTARLLFLPAKRSPGLGVGGWFIPIVNFWFPYQALRDCLPPGDPGRTVIARWWTFYISTTVVLLTTEILAFIGNPIGFVFAAIGLLLAAGFAVEGTKAVRLIADAHRRVLYPGTSG
jgi:hypothetical protein